MRLGLIAQTRDHGHYELGPYARHLGLVAIRGMDVVRASAAPLENLRHVVKQGAFLSVWGNRGPTIVSTVDGPQEMPMSVRIGYVMPVLYTATGRVFLSYLPREATHPLVTEELVATLREKGAEATNKMASSINRIVKDCRRAGFSCTEGLLNPRIAGVAAPVFDHRGSLAAVVTVIGLGDQLDVRPESRNVRMLLRATEEISTALGFHADLHNESSIAGTSDEWASLTAADIGEDV